MATDYVCNDCGLEHSSPYGCPECGGDGTFQDNNHYQYDSLEEIEQENQAHETENIYSEHDTLYLPDPNWCPDCGEPRGVCRCDEMQGDDWNPDYPYDDLDPVDEQERACPVCGQLLDCEEHAVSCPHYGVAL